MKFFKHLYSIFRFKCPRCLKGEFLCTPNVYNLKKAGDLHEKCSNCGLKYEKEIGFFYGAMYVSYALGVALFVANWVAFEILFDDYNTMILVASIVISTVVAAPYIYALSKIIWINLFVKCEA